MNDVQLMAVPRQTAGSAACRRLRAAGKVPAVLYGGGMEPQSLVVDGRELRQALTGPSGLNALLAIEVGAASHIALARQVQKAPLTGMLNHVDFLVVSRDEIVTAEVPVHLVGEAIEVHRADGLVEQQLFSLPVKAKPGDIPAQIEVDVTSLAVGETVRVADLALPPGVEADIDGDEPVVSGVGTLPEAEDEAGAGDGGAEAGATTSGT